MRENLMNMITIILMIIMYACVYDWASTQSMLDAEPRTRIPCLDLLGTTSKPKRMWNNIHNNNNLRMPFVMLEKFLVS